MSKKKKIIIAVCIVLALGAIGNMSGGDSTDQEDISETAALEDNNSEAENAEEEQVKENEEDKENEEETKAEEEKELTKEEKEQQEKERKAEQREQEKKEIKDIIDGFTEIFADEPDEEDIDMLKGYNQKRVFREFNRQIKQLSVTETGNITKLLTAFAMVFPEYKESSDEIIAMAEVYEKINGSIDFSERDIQKKQNQADSLEKNLAEAVYMDVYIYQEINMRLLGNAANWLTGQTVYDFETTDGMEGALYTYEKFPEAGYYSIRCLDMGETLAVEDEQGFGGDIPKYEYLPDSTEEELAQAKDELENMKAKMESRDSAEKKLGKRLKEGFVLE